jgi:streptogramin lyase
LYWKVITGFALACLAGCSSAGGDLLGRAPQAGGPATVRSGSLSFTVYTAGQTPGFPAHASAVDLAAGPGGYMWFTDGGTPAIGRIAPNGTVTEFTTGLPSGAQPYSIVAGADGNMWFSDHRGVAIGEITPSGTITEYAATQYANSSALGIAFGPAGEPWIVGFGSQPLLAHLTPSGSIAAQLLPVLMTPNGALAADSLDNLWFVAQNSKAKGELVERPAQKSKIRSTPLRMVSIFLPCCPNVAPKSIAIGPDGNPWFTTLDFGRPKSSAQFIGTRRAGRVHLIKITHKGLSGSAYASGLAAAADGLWMTGGNVFQDAGALWHVDASGTQIAYNLPYDPLGLAVDADGNPWFTAAFSGQPSRIVEVTGAR